MFEIFFFFQIYKVYCVFIIFLIDSQKFVIRREVDIFVGLFEDFVVDYFVFSI